MVEAGAIRTHSACRMMPRLVCGEVHRCDVEKMVEAVI